MPGIVIDPSLRAIASGRNDDERPTGPHLLDPNMGSLSQEMTEEIPTREVIVGPPTSPLPAGIEPPTGPEPVTSQVQLTPEPSEPDLPSVMVAPMAGAQPTTLIVPKATPFQPKSNAGRVMTSPVLMPASQVRTPEVVAPLPKALEKSRPDDNAVTDRGTRGRRTNLVIVLMPLLAVLGLAGLVGWTVLRSAETTEDDDAYSTRNNKGRMAAPKKVLINLGEAKEGDPTPPEPEDDDVKDLPAKPTAPYPPVVTPGATAPAAQAPLANPPPLSKAVECAKRLKGVADKRGKRLDVVMRSQVDAMWNASSSTPDSDSYFIERCNQLRETIQRLK
jgi:hypothetical protein